MSFVVNEINWFLENLHLPVTVPSLLIWPCCISKGNCLPFCLLAQIYLSGFSEIFSNVPSSMLSSKTPIHHLPLFWGLLSRFLCSWFFEFFLNGSAHILLDMRVGKDSSFLQVLSPLAGIEWPWEACVSHLVFIQGLPPAQQKFHSFCFFSLLPSSYSTTGRWWHSHMTAHIKWHWGQSCSFSPKLCSSTALCPPSLWSWRNQGFHHTGQAANQLSPRILSQWPASQSALPVNFLTLASK